MRKILVALKTLTIINCFCVLQLNAQSNLSSLRIRTPFSQQFNSFTPISSSPSYQINSGGSLPTNSNRLNPQLNQQQQFKRANEELKRQEQAKYIKKDLQDEELEYRDYAFRKAVELYKDAYTQILSTRDDDFSITKAVYLVENAFYENQFSYQEFQKAIKEKASLCEQVLKAEKLNPNDNLAKIGRAH